MAHALNVSFQISFMLANSHFINPVDKTKYLPCNAPHRHSTTVSFETCFLYLLIEPVKGHFGEEVDSLRKVGALLKFGEEPLRGTKILFCVNLTDSSILFNSNKEDCFD